MQATSYILVQTFNRDVLHRAAPLLSHVSSVHKYTTKAGPQFHVSVDNGLVLIMPKAVYGYFINGEHIALPDTETIRTEGMVPAHLKDVAEKTNDKWLSNNYYYSFEED